MFLIFDTETTGLPKSYRAPITDVDNWPRAVQIAWQLHDTDGSLVEQKDFLIRPDGFNIPYESEQIHGISTDLAQAEGVSLEEVCMAFNEAIAKATFIVGQNIDFDVNIMGCEFFRINLENELSSKSVLDTCTEDTAQLCMLPGGRGGRYKLPTLTELHQHLFNQAFAEAHNATADVEATTRCFFELIRQGHFEQKHPDLNQNFYQNFRTINTDVIEGIGLKHRNLKEASLRLLKAKENETTSDNQTEDHFDALKDLPFGHLHNHSQFSILQSTLSPKRLVQLASTQKMQIVALTDHGNMMGAFTFMDEIKVHNENHPDEPLLGVLGCELNVVENRFEKTRKDYGYAMVFLAKNKRGYHNLTKLCSKAYTEGFYYIPRIDRELVETYKEDLIVLSGNLQGEIASKILNQGERQAEEALVWWKNQFGADFYLEIMRHQQEDENRVNKSLIEFSAQHQVKLVATNNSYYAIEEESDVQDILLCVKDGELKETPVGRGRGFRYGLPNNQYYFKNKLEMKTLFSDLPEAIESVAEIMSKVENYHLAREVLLPKFDIPKDFLEEEDLVDGGKRGENNYLRHLTYQGAEERYGSIDEDLKSRLDFELQIIENSGYPGYFLIVEDFIREARNMGVSVGPGRGSAAGSAVAYCLKITNIDPIKYELLFERFLNPDRVSMPDIDIDFDDEGRQKVIDYVIDKYGSNQVAQIITYGTMAGKSSIRDTSRVLDLPLSEADRLAKLLPDMTKLKKIWDMDKAELSKKYRSEDAAKINELKDIASRNDELGKTLQLAKNIEGTVRNTGIHACGVIITPDDITNFIPVATAKDADMWVTQFDNSVVENAGLLKMDFLGLKTLTLIKDTVKIVKARSGIQLIPDEFPLDDTKTYELFQRGETVGIFQYESRGMQKYLKELKPSVFDDLIAMNALYRPGPLEYIPSFINRKHGVEPITYDLPEMKEYLEATYGITVYQEQVMLLSQKLADFTKGEADVLRKAMGKKKFDLIDELRPKFINGGIKNGHPQEVLEKIYKDWEAFASYAFNKSHSTCYAYIAYQTAYLKAHYPAEYMAAVLSNNMNQLEQVTLFMEEAKRMGLEVLGPDINESYYKFSVNKNNAIRFGMGAIKGVGKSAVQTIVEERKENGEYFSSFDLAKRIDLRAANKKSFENMALAGCFDSFGAHRAQYFQETADGMNYLEKTVRSAQRYQESQNASQGNLFEDDESVQINAPVIPDCETWGTMECLRKEKEVVGLYLTGHPLDDFKREIKQFTKGNIALFQKDLKEFINKEIVVAGIVTDFEHRISKNGKGWGLITLEDYNGSHQFRMFGEEYLKFKHFYGLHNFLHLKIFIKEGWVNKETGVKGDPRLQFNDIKLLQDVMEHYSNKLTLFMKTEEINENRISELKNVLAQYPGKKKLQFALHDESAEINLQLKSHKQKIDINTNLLNALEDLELNFSLN